MKFRLYLQEGYCYFGRIQLSFYCFFSLFNLKGRFVFVIHCFKFFTGMFLYSSSEWLNHFRFETSRLPIFSLNGLIVRRMENFSGDISSSSVFDGDIKLSHWKCHYSTWMVNTNSINCFSSSSGEIWVVRMSYVVLSHRWR